MPETALSRCRQDDRIAMKTRQFEVRKDDLAVTEIVSKDVHDIGDGEILCKVDRFALTANNITYGVVGEKIGYWKFFKAREGWGVIPVWGFAEVVESKHPEISEGERLYGYLPTATHLVMQPGKTAKERFADATAHRAELPPVYNSYARVLAESRYDPSMDDERMLLFPLYATSFCIQDFLGDNDYFGATQIIVPSASSKTAIGLAYALDADTNGPKSVGLTSAGHVDSVKQLGLYDSVLSYDRIRDIDNAAPSVIVDMSGNGSVLSDLHAHLGDNMKFTSNVGLTHFEANDMGPNFIHERSQMFFAPGHIQKRTKEWGPGVFEKKAMEFWYDAALKSRKWLSFECHQGMKSLSDVYQQVLAGKVSPHKGIVIDV